MIIQVEAVVAAAAVALAAGLGLRLWAWRAGRAAARGGLEPAAQAYILYFTSQDCAVCRTHQEPALAALQGVRVRRVDALAEPELARRFQVFTVPSTVVVGPQGTALHVNYGYAPAAKLRRQLAAHQPLSVPGALEFIEDAVK